jgi:uncharacterized membrane protein YdjX (TVP38/TMEM64 family)
MKLGKKVLIPIVLLLLVIVGFAAVRQGWFENWSPESFREFIEGFGNWAIVVYFLLVILNTITIMPPLVLTLLLAGVLFDPIKGIIVLWTSMVLGSIIAFSIARFIGQDFVSRKLKGRADEFNEQLSENGFTIVLTIRLIGIPPPELINYAAGLSKISFRDFVLAVMIGSMPVAVLFVLTGDRLINLDFRDPLMYSLPAFAVLTLLITRLVSRLKQRK